MGEVGQVMTDVALRALTVADTAAIQCALALVIGSLASRRWLRESTSDWAREVVRLSRRWLVFGVLLAIAADVAAVWLQAVVMLDSPAAALGPMMLMVLRETHFGSAWWFGAAALLGALFVSISTAAGMMEEIVSLAVAVFAASRSVVSHADDQGDFSLKVGVDWVHLLAVSLWVGIVLASVLVVFRRPPRGRLDGADAVHWLSALSDTATVALVVIVLTGTLKTWWATPSFQLLAASDYGRVLGVKLVMVAVAVGLGGYNRFRAMPRLLKTLMDPAAAHESFRGRFAYVLRLEAAVLFCAVVSAAFLSNIATPGEE